MSDVEKVVEALRAADWAGVSIGNKALIKKAIELLQGESEAAQRVRQYLKDNQERLTRYVSNDESSVEFRGPLAGPVEESAEDAWRKLALQFDNHRMTALGYLKGVVTGVIDVGQIKEFLQSPPTAGSDILAEHRDLRAVLEEILGCPQWTEEKTIPAGGVEAAPEQVIVNMSVAWVRLRKARAILDGLKVTPSMIECTDAMVSAGFAELEKRGFRVGASDLGMDDLRAVFKAMAATATNSKK